MRTRAAMVAMVACGLLCPRIEAWAARVELFSLAYDYRDSDFGIYQGNLLTRAQESRPALMLLHVDPGGDVWLASSPFRVRRFNRTGEFLGRAGTGLHPGDEPHEPHELPEGFRGLPWQFVSAMTGFAASPDGRSVMLCEPDARPIVFDAHGTMLISWIDEAIYVRHELRGEEKIVYQLRRELGIVWPEVTDVRWDADANLYLAVANPGGPIEGWTGPVLAKFGPEQDWIGWRRGGDVGTNGVTFCLQPDGEAGPLTRLLRFDADGEALPHLRLIPEGREAGDDFDPQAGWAPPQHMAMDRAGNVFLSYWGACAYPSSEAMAPLEVDARIHGFGTDGGWRRMVVAPRAARTAIGPPVAIGPAGDVHYGVFGDERFYVQVITLSGARDG